MSWSDIETARTDLDAALSSYDWELAGRICSAIIRRTRDERETCPPDTAKAILAALRGKRRFDLIARVAEAFIFSGQDAGRIRRQYAQALIDSEWLFAAEPILQALAAESLEGDSQVGEAHGLLGRVYKQRYVNADRPNSRYARAAFERSLAEYLQTYRLNPLRNYWHGVNVVALLHRGIADRISVTHAPNADLLAQDILETLRNSPDDPDPFTLATRAEALLSLKDYRGAEEALLEYSRHPKTDAFEASSTLRQFEEVWRLRDDTPPGDTLLAILRAARLRGEGGALQGSPAQLNAELAVVTQANSKLQGNFGLDKTVTVNWFETGLTRTQSIARIERGGRGKGTGWIVRAEDFFPGRSGPLLLTNAHVINGNGAGGALRPSQAIVNFQRLGKTFALSDDIVWSSPVSQFDATFLQFAGEPPTTAPIPVSPYEVELYEPPQRVYIMGHPDGRDLEFAIHDNKLVACVNPYLHYRTPTEGGNSGSPVFEHTAWEVVALHHAGEPSADRAGHKPAYTANEGIAITVLMAATKSGSASTAAS